MKKSMLLGAAVVLLVCGLMLGGCKDDSPGGFAELNGLWDRTGTDYTLNIGGTVFTFTMSYMGVDVVVTGNFDGLEESSTAHQYLADGRVISLTVDNIPQDVSDFSDTLPTTLSVAGDTMVVYVNTAGAGGYAAYISLLNGNYTK
jgi:hypothetical protein